MKNQRGVAAVTALLIVAIAASTATYMLAQQSAMLNQASLVANRAQADLYARAGLDWARGVIAQDAKSAGSVDSLEEAWAQPIAGLPVERALVAGQIVDEQAKFNLNNLVRGTTKSDNDLAILRRLLESLEIPPDLAFAVLDWIDPDSDLSGVAGAEDGFYLALARPYRAANQPMTQVEELHRIRGFTPAYVAKLKPFVTALPAVTTVNVNTAPIEVLAAILPDLSRAQVAALVESRRGKPMRTKAEISERAKNVPASTVANDLDVKSAHFRARVQVAQDDVQLATEALLRREQNAGVTVIVWRRPLY
ncbi:type II secretion system minor pseudopilin GspK [Usitatibacter palustris]|uniref:Type II secretion system protein K n=1 Tax=Usitatibacter palustris TaxID=2732487 RepID=A0A6M4H989_9PROT|nr:type II secretion system minor pseudopilin GspK [Usitatibacter palustris]QJR15765.1 Type II secretion system protein K [Usitatibacter palustris]